MKYIVLCVALMVFVGCATKNAKVKTSPISAEMKDMPEWIHSIDEACDNATEICASSEGTSIINADLNAKKSLASIFQTKIKSNLTLENYGFTAPEAEAIAERVSNTVTESVNVLLKATYIKERFSKDGLYFSLAVLDKDKVKKSLRLEINALDDQIDFIHNKGLKSSLIKLHVLFNKRQALNDKYVIISGSSLPTNMSFSKISSLKYSKNSLNKISFKLVGDVPRIIAKKIEAMFSEMGYKIVSTGKQNYGIRIKYNMKDEYLNVKGFKKFLVILSLEAKLIGGDILGAYTTQKEALGRNKQDAFLKIKDLIIEDIRNNIDKLNIK
jgi:hypothetical protein